MTTQLSKERLEEVANNPERYSEIAVAMARALLAAYEQEPVAYIFKHPFGKQFWFLVDESCKNHKDVLPVHSHPAPSTPAVPTFEEWSRGCKIQLQLCYPEFRELAEYTWNACRAAMLNGGKS